MTEQLLTPEKLHAAQKTAQELLAHKVKSSVDNEGAISIAKVLKEFIPDIVNLIFMLEEHSPETLRLHREILEEGIVPGELQKLWWGKENMDVEIRDLDGALNKLATKGEVDWHVLKNAPALLGRLVEHTATLAADTEAEADKKHVEEDKYAWLYIQSKVREINNALGISELEATTQGLFDAAGRFRKAVYESTRLYDSEQARSSGNLAWILTYASGGNYCHKYEGEMGVEVWKLYRAFQMIDDLGQTISGHRDSKTGDWHDQKQHPIEAFKQWEDKVLKEHRGRKNPMYVLKNLKGTLENIIGATQTGEPIHKKLSILLGLAKQTGFFKAIEEAFPKLSRTYDDFVSAIRPREKLEMLASNFDLFKRELERINTLSDEELWKLDRTQQKDRTYFATLKNLHQSLPDEPLALQLHLAITAIERLCTTRISDFNSWKQKLSEQERYNVRNIEGIWHQLSAQYDEASIEGKVIHQAKRRFDRHDLGSGIYNLSLKENQRV